MVIRNEGEEFFHEKGDQGGGSLWKSQHLLQDSHHTLPTKALQHYKSDYKHLNKLMIISGKLDKIKDFARQNKKGLDTHY